MKNIFTHRTTLTILIMVAVCIACFISYTATQLLKSKFDENKPEKWLDILRANHASRENALKIVSVEYDYKNNLLKCNVPLDYDLLKKYEIIDRDGNGFSRKGLLEIEINNHGYLCKYNRSIAGTCVVICDVSNECWDLQGQMIQVRLYLLVQPTMNLENACSMYGPPTNVILNRIPVQLKWNPTIIPLGTNLYKQQLEILGRRNSQ